MRSRAINSAEQLQQELRETGKENRASKKLLILSANNNICLEVEIRFVSSLSLT